MKGLEKDIYADATNTNFTNYPVIKWSVINCRVIKCHQTRLVINCLRD